MTSWTAATARSFAQALGVSHQGVTIQEVPGIIDSLPANGIAGPEANQRLAGLTRSWIDTVTADPELATNLGVQAHRILPNGIRHVTLPLSDHTVRLVSRPSTTMALQHVELDVEHLPTRRSVAVDIHEDGTVPYVTFSMFLFFDSSMDPLMAKALGQPHDLSLLEIGTQIAGRLGFDEVSTEDSFIRSLDGRTNEAGHSLSIAVEFPEFPSDKRGLKVTLSGSQWSARESDTPCTPQLALCGPEIAFWNTIGELAEIREQYARTVARLVFP